MTPGQNGVGHALRHVDDGEGRAGHQVGADVPTLQLQLGRHAPSSRPLPETRDPGDRRQFAAALLGRDSVSLRHDLLHFLGIEGIVRQRAPGASCCVPGKTSKVGVKSTSMPASVLQDRRVALDFRRAVPQMRLKGLGADQRLVEVRAVDRQRQVGVWRPDSP